MEGGFERRPGGFVTVNVAKAPGMNDAQLADLAAERMDDVPALSLDLAHARAEILRLRGP